MVCDQFTLSMVRVLRVLRRPLRGRPDDVTRTFASHVAGDAWWKHGTLICILS